VTIASAADRFPEANAARVAGSGCGHNIPQSKKLHKGDLDCYAARLRPLRVIGTVRVLRVGDNIMQ
jgi:hypothetical protein